MKSKQTNEKKKRKITTNKIIIVLIKGAYKSIKYMKFDWRFAYIIYLFIFL